MREPPAEQAAASRSRQPLVSIVMPTYNRAHLLGQAIDAVRDQTYRNLELIIVNDGSSDGTPDLLAKYQASDPRIRVVHKHNQGIPDTVNRGWLEAKGQYLTWTSDDNLYHPTAIETMVAYLESHPETAMVYTDCRYIDGEGAFLYDPPGREPEALETGCPIAGCLLFRRHVLDEVGMFRRQWKRCHDFDFYHRVYRRFKVARIPEILYDYRLHQASMTGDLYAILTEHAQCLASHAQNRRGRGAAWAMCWHEVARQAQREARNWSAVWFFLKAAVREPRRAFTFWDALWRTAYSSLPSPVRRAWRWAKQTARRKGRAPQ